MSEFFKSSCLQTWKHESGLGECRKRPKDSGYQVLSSVYLAIFKNGTVCF